MSTSRPQYEFRVTKYDPSNRSPAGHYLGDEWYWFGQVEEGKVSLQECTAVENYYISAAISLLEDDSSNSLLAIDPDRPEKSGKSIALNDLSHWLRPCLREQSNFRFHCGNRFIHVGRDYYMYVGVNSVKQKTFAKIEQSGLFIEPFLSPYFQETGP